MRLRTGWPTALCALFAAIEGCGRDATAPGRHAPARLTNVIVSTPISPIPGRGTSRSAENRSAFGSSSNGDASFVYVSMAPGSDSIGLAATIRVGSTGISQSTAMIDGGFDPRGIAAQVGDTLWISIQESTGASTDGYTLVPSRVAPAIVRTSPAAGRTDVPLNTIISIVFSEPMDSASVAAGVRLVLHGADVSGSISAAADNSGSLRFEFRPSAALIPNSTYELGISDSVRNAAGAPLGTAITIDFTTSDETSAPPAELQAGSLRMIEFKISDDTYEQVPQLVVQASPSATGVYITSFTMLSMPSENPVDYPWTCFADEQILPGTSFQLFTELVTGEYPLETYSTTPLAGTGTVTASLTYHGADGVMHSIELSSEIESRPFPDTRGNGSMQFGRCVTG